MMPKKTFLQRPSFHEDVAGGVSVLMSAVVLDGASSGRAPSGGSPRADGRDTAIVPVEGGSG